MVKEEIGFSHGVPENPDKTWETQINGRTFIFTKSRQKKGNVFLYRCGRHSDSTESATSFYSERDLSPKEVEELPQFATFISA